MNSTYVSLLREIRPDQKKNASLYNSSMSIESLIGSNEFYCFILCHETL